MEIGQRKQQKQNHKGFLAILTDSAITVLHYIVLLTFKDSYIFIFIFIYYIRISFEAKETELDWFFYSVAKFGAFGVEVGSTNAISVE